VAEKAENRDIEKGGATAQNGPSYEGDPSPCPDESKARQAPDGLTREAAPRPRLKPMEHVTLIGLTPNSRTSAIFRDSRIYALPFSS